MRAWHTAPCSECPFRRTSPQGYLGGWAPEHYADAIQAGVITACHQQDHGPEQDSTAFCAGAASVMANNCQVPIGNEPGQSGAMEFRNEVGRREDTFINAAAFYQYHAGLAYVPFPLRPKP